MKKWLRLPGEHPKWTDVAIVVLTVGIVCLAYMQWREMHEGGAQTDRIIAADERMAKGIEETLRLSKESYAGANRQATLSQRAWIGVRVSTAPQGSNETSSPTEQPTPLIVGKPADLRVSIKNTGRTPALNVRSVIQRTPIERSGAGELAYPAFEYKDSDYLLDPALEPDGVFYGDFFYPVVTKEDKSRLESQKVRIYVHGRIEFDDVFGVHHWRNFCGFLLPTGAFAACLVHNDLDNNQGGD